MVLLVCLMVWWCYGGVTCVPHGMVVLWWCYLCASWYGGVMVVLLVCLMVWWCYGGVTCVPHGMVVL